MICRILHQAVLSSLLSLKLCTSVKPSAILKVCVMSDASYIIRVGPHVQTADKGTSRLFGCVVLEAGHD
jgi:hypothetical protein